MAVSLGADALGFLIGLDYQTEDEIAVEAARSIISRLPPFIVSVLVTHRTEPLWVEETCRTLRSTAVQLHGNFPLADLPALRAKLPHVKLIKTIHVQDHGALTLARQAAPFADAVLLDSITGARIGGTGTVHDWSISATIVDQLHTPVILAGGLTPENVQKAIRLVRPFAVDVNSGVERPDGTKSPDRIEQFILRSRQALLNSRRHATP